MCHKYRIQPRRHFEPVWWADDQRFGIADTLPIWAAAGVIAAAFATLLTV